jgi:hypothetical protein
MDSLKRLRNEEIKSTLHREIGKQLHGMYDPVAKDELPSRLEELMLRLDERLHEFRRGILPTGLSVVS